MIFFLRDKLELRNIHALEHMFPVVPHEEKLFHSIANSFCLHQKQMKMFDGLFILKLNVENDPLDNIFYIVVVV